MVKFGVKASDETASVAEIEARTRIGRPMASPERIAEAERAMLRKLCPAMRGPKPRDRHDGTS